MAELTSRTVNLNWLDRHLKSEEEVRLYAHDSCMLVVTESILGQMEQAGISRAELAIRLGRSKSFISQTLTGSKNMTLRTMADILWACGLELRGLDVSPIGEMTIPMERIDSWLDGEEAGARTATQDAAASTDKAFTLEISLDSNSNQMAAA